MSSSRDFTFIQNDQVFRDYHKSLKERGVLTIALDFEGEFNLHVYGNHLCLIQIFDGERFLAVDPFKLSTESMKAFFEDKNLLKIMYDAASDGSLVFENYGIILRTVLDLRPVPDILNFEKRDLSSVLNTALGIDVIKKKQFQMHNWMSRPINNEAMDYAMDDVAELFRLKDWMLAALSEKGLLDEYMRRNLNVQHEGATKADRKPRIMKSREYDDLNKAQRETFGKILALREEIAKKLNLPPNTVVANAALFDLARNRMTVHDIRFNRQISSSSHEGIRAEISKSLTPT